MPSRLAFQKEQRGKITLINSLDARTELRILGEVGTDPSGTQLNRAGCFKHYVYPGSNDRLLFGEVCFVKSKCSVPCSPRWVVRGSIASPLPLVWLIKLEQSIPSLFSPLPVSYFTAALISFSFSGLKWLLFKFGREDK